MNIRAINDISNPILRDPAEETEGATYKYYIDANKNGEIDEGEVEAQGITIDAVNDVVGGFIPSWGKNWTAQWILSDITLA